MNKKMFEIGQASWLDENGKWRKASISVSINRRPSSWLDEDGKWKKASIDRRSSRNLDIGNCNSNDSTIYTLAIENIDSPVRKQ